MRSHSTLTRVSKTGPSLGKTGNLGIAGGNAKR